MDIDSKKGSTSKNHCFKINLKINKLFLLHELMDIDSKKGS